jgi:hypothetical protein
MMAQLNEASQHAETARQMRDQAVEIFRRLSAVEPLTPASS